ncbi:MFS transporter [Microbacterium sp. NPDC087591]|jgi:MFS family permease|uniref:MFS transporter n=1 Tax=Microbacterium sp. NPDC087591 TaxID=3364192 RepID=UPI0038135375
MTTPTSTRPRTIGFWVVAIAFLLVMAYSTVPTPLYPLYQQEDGFPVATITVIFAAYAVGVVASLFLLGHVSDWMGRRRMLVIAVLVSTLSAVLFMVFTDVAGLLVARVINGVSIGVLTATATAHLSELRARARPEENSIVAASVAGGANLGGLALGPLLGGVFADFFPDPLHLPHTVFAIVLILLAVALTLVPETVTVAPRAYRPQRIAVPATSRSAFVAAGFAAFAGFALFGMFTSLAPSILIGTFELTDHLVAGLTVFAVFGSAAAAQVVLASVPRRTQLLFAAIACGLGLAAIALGAVLALFALFIIGGVIGGAGVGALFKCSLAVAGELAEDGRRGETLAAIFLVAYCGLALPVLAIGAALSFAPQLVVLLVFVVVVGVVTVTAALRMRHQSR